MYKQPQSPILEVQPMTLLFEGSAMFGGGTDQHGTTDPIYND